MVTHERVARRRRPSGASGLSSARRVLAHALGGLRLLSLLLVPLRDDISLSTEILTFLLAVVSVALLGGVQPAVLAALAGFALLNYYFTPPFYRFTVGSARTSSRWWFSCWLRWP